MNDPPDEVDWVRKAQAGDQQAFAALSDRYWMSLRRWLYGLCGHDAVSEDIAQDAFLRAWTSLGQLKNRAIFRVWLFRIARRLFLDRQRDVRERKRRPQDFEIPSARAGPLEELVEREGWRELTAALARLPNHYREAYLLWNQENWPYHQIASVLGVTEETVRWRVCVARQTLVKELEAYLKP